MNRLIVFALTAFLMMTCQPETNEQTGMSFRLVTLDPGHFHAALVQKTMLKNVDSTVHVYAPPGNDLTLHLNRIRTFNERSENPTHWNEVVYTGEDFWSLFLREKKGNVVVLAGNNKKKTEYIIRSLEAGYHVLADKPMAISANDFVQLKKAFEVAREKKRLLYDIMTERSEITTLLQREFSMVPEVFGGLVKGSVDNPAVTKESVHHFHKFVSGSVLIRPPWFMDVRQQGEGIVDVTTHLVDLVQWECFPEQTLKEEDVQILSARRWATPMSKAEFQAITQADDFPAYLTPDVVNDTLQVFANGEINYTLRGVHAKVSVRWAYQAPEGTGDTHYSILRGARANLVILQGVAEGYKPALYIEWQGEQTPDLEFLKQKAASVLEKYPGVDLRPAGHARWEVIIPEEYKEGHEAHFGRVMERFTGYLENGSLPEWEEPNMLVKYYTTTRALSIAAQQ
jgi:predicted dehydrogenase